MTITDDEILAAAKAMFNSCVHYPEDGYELGLIYTWETYGDISRGHYLKTARIALEAAEKAREVK